MHCMRNSWTLFGNEVLASIHVGHYQIEIFLSSAQYFQCLLRVGREVDSVDDSVDFTDADIDDDHVDIASLFDNPPPQIEEGEGLVEVERKSCQLGLFYEKQSQLCFDKWIRVSA